MLVPYEYQAAKCPKCNRYEPKWKRGIAPVAPVPGGQSVPQFDPPFVPQFDPRESLAEILWDSGP